MTMVSVLCGWVLLCLRYYCVGGRFCVYIILCEWVLLCRCFFCVGGCSCAVGLLICWWVIACRGLLMLMAVMLQERDMVKLKKRNKGNMNDDDNNISIIRQ